MLKRRRVIIEWECDTCAGITKEDFHGNKKPATCSHCGQSAYHECVYIDSFQGCEVLKHFKGGCLLGLEPNRLVDILPTMRLKSDAEVLEKWLTYWSLNNVPWIMVQKPRKGTVAVWKEVA